MYLNRDIGYIFFRVAGRVRRMTFPISSVIYFPEYWKTEWRNEKGILMVQGRSVGLSSSILIAILSYHVTVFHVVMCLITTLCLIKYSGQEGLALILEKLYPHMSSMLYQINMSNPESILNVDLNEQQLLYLSFILIRHANHLDHINVLAWLKDCLHDGHMH